MLTFASFLHATGAALSNLVLVLVLDPDAFVLGGGLSDIAKLYLELPQAVACHLFAGAQRLLFSPAFGNAGGVLGAAILGSLLKSA